MKNFRNRQLVFVGRAKKARDIEFVCEIRLAKIIETVEEYSEDLSEYFFIFEKERQELADIIIEKKQLRETQYCYDEDIFDYFNVELTEQYLAEEIAIWGTGQVCDYFLTNFNKAEIKSKVKYFVCTNSAEKEKNGVPVLTPQEICLKECKIVVAVNYENFREIEKECEKIGIARERYIYYTRLFDNPGDLLRQTYYDEHYFPSECFNQDQTIRVQNNGNICMCCLSCVKNIMGNIYEQDFVDAWDSRRARICRLSVLNHTYSFCDHFRCPFLRGIQSDTDIAQYDRPYSFHKTQYPVSIAPEVDISCNLHCTSCREKVFVEQKENSNFWRKIIYEKLAILPVSLILNTVGEPFASAGCMELMDRIEHSVCQLAIYTNGTLLTPDKLEEILQKHHSIELSLSIDAASKETYERIRRGGNYEKLMDNIAYISQEKKQGRISYWRVNFVVQKSNIQEMGLFVEQAKAWGVNQVFFQEIENWGIYEDEEYREIRVTRDGRIKKEYEQYFTEELKACPLVQWGNLTHVINGKDSFIKMI